MIPSSLHAAIVLDYVPRIWLPSGVPSAVRSFISIFFLVFMFTESLWPQTGGSSVTQSVTIEVRPITRMAVTGDPGPLVINRVSPEPSPLIVQDNNTRYSITTNLDMMKIVASINNKMPEGTRLMVMLSSSKGQSTGSVDVSDATSPVDVVTGIGRCSDFNQSISYTFAANAGTEEVPVQTRVVTLTLTD